MIRKLLLLFAFLPLLASAQNQKPALLITPDLRFYDLMGPVKTVKYEYNTLEFNRQGKLVKYDDVDPFDEKKVRELFEQDQAFRVGFKHNKKGQIVRMDGYESTTVYFWAGNTIVTGYEGSGEGMQWKGWFIYDENGNLVKEIRKDWDETNNENINSVTPSVTTYRVIEEDSYGNWIRRVFTINDSTETETREITYF